MILGVPSNDVRYLEAVLDAALDATAEHIMVKARRQKEA
jgi:hypothetical protein